MISARHPPGFSARVDGASLSDLIQLNCLAGRRATFEVSSGDRVGHLFFDRGAVIHAEFGGIVGEEAVQCMFGLESGRFRPSTRPWPKVPTITASWESMILRVAVARDEQAAGKTVRGQLVEFPGVSRAMFDEEEFDEDGQVPSNAAALKLTRTGEVLSSRGNTEGLAETAAFVHGLGNLIGDALGIGALAAIEASASERTVTVHRESDGTLLALRGTADELNQLQKGMVIA